MMNNEKIVHAYIDCEICKKKITQYLGDPIQFETIHKDDNSIVDACLPCVESYYAALRQEDEAHG